MFGEAVEESETLTSNKGFLITRVGVIPPTALAIGGSVAY
jgi:hypothetical protein